MVEFKKITFKGDWWGGRVSPSIENIINTYVEYAKDQVEQQKGASSFMIFNQVSTEGVATNQLQEEVHKLKDRQDLMEARVDQLEFQTNVMPFKDKLEKIHEFVVKTFSELDWIKNISYYPTGHGLQLVIIHELDNRIEALNQIQKRFFQIEDAFSGIYFEQIVLHISQLEPELLTSARTILQK